MDQDRWGRVKALFAAALDLPAASREHALRELCPDDDRLRAEVHALLSAHEERGFVDELAGRLQSPRGRSLEDPRPGTRVGRYEIIEHLGRGGMGIVWKARDRQLDRFVAVKLLSRETTPQGQHRADLLREARAAAALDHPAIATVYEVGEAEDGRVFLAMAYYDGETLEARLKGGALPPEAAVRFGREIAGGLAAAHARGVIHCDLKPANVLITRSGALKLLDFGIARLSDDETRAGVLAGTLGYMAPEQFQGTPADSRADVWAFGIVLFEMLTGERPFGQTPSAHWTSDPSTLRGPHGAVPPPLEAIVRRALARDPRERFRDGAELLTAFEGLVQAPAAGPGAGRLVRVPAPLTAFFGRERDIQAVAQLLGTSRLLTLTGPGGIGKTRLAQQVASEVADRFEHGVVFVSLASISDPGLVCSEIARGMSIPERPDASVLDALIARLAHQRMLLILDNFEHVRLAAAALSRLLADCQELRLLVTSRVPLKLTGEQEYPVPPLARPFESPAGEAPDLDTSPATALFVDRVRAARPHFTPTPDDARAIVELCAQLDGLPLAIELAAARAKMFSPRAILTRLDDRLDWLRTRAVDRPERHQSLRQAVAWSYDLLDPAEQAVFRAMAVFRGGCGIDDAAAVACAMRQDPADLGDACEALVDHSLVVRREATDGSPRLAMLETIREFALERLHAGGEAAAARRAHAERCLALAETAAPHVTGPDQADWFDRLERDHANLRGALSWAQGEGHAELAMRLGAALWRFWIARGHLREGRERLEQLLAMPGAERPTLLRAHVLHGAATLVHEISEYARALPLAEESLAIARQHGDGPLTGVALNNVAWLLVRVGDPAAERLCDEALAFNRELGDRRGVAIALHDLGWLFAFRADYERASALNEESLEWRRAHGDPRGIAFAMTDLGLTELRRGALDRAGALLAEAQSILERLGDRQLLAWALAIQGLLERAAGRPAEAADRFARSIELWQEVGNILGLGFALAGEAEVRLDSGDAERARQNLETAIPLLRRAGACAELSEALRVRARLAIQEGDVRSAGACYRESLELAHRVLNRRAIAECEDALARLGGR